MRDSLLSCPQWSQLPSGMSGVDDGLSKTAATHTIPLVTELGKGNAEKLTMMKVRNEQNEKIVSMANEKYAVWKEIDLFRFVPYTRRV